MLIRLIFCLLITTPVLATVFQMQTVDQQIKESDSIMIGHYLKSKTIRMDDGSLATQMIFKMEKEFGLQSELFGMDEVIIHYPGGKMGHQIVRVDGVPQFVSGEKVVLMITSRDDRYWGMNLGFGTFKVVNYGNEKMLINSIFPENTQVGQIRVADFEKKVRTIKGSGLKVVRSEVYPTERDSSRVPASVTEEKNRTIASQTEEVENKESEPQSNVMWLVVFLAFLGGVFRFLKHKEVK